MHFLKGWIAPVVVAILGCTTAISTYSLARARSQAAVLAADNRALNATTAQIQRQLDLVSRKLAEVESSREAPVPQSKAARPKAVRPVVRTARRTPRSAEDPRINQLKAELSQQKQDLADARDKIQQTRDDLEGKLDSTHDELSGSIARTHDELIELQKRGERNFYEFEADKSKQFQKVGPIRVSLRKVNVKHKRYDLALLVDDMEIEKKGVNLFEPVWITLADRPQPLELVVNQVRKDEVQGYLSEPKYKTSQITAAK